ncbi:MAG TPA: hypothetical protein DIU15_20900 [Deltaproteobacteria bacterium]|nr:hypothetical protein [Deltaproteobacteria bacterium]HCP48509.1 hypothetical protein [Deltaproteobacteria bacterium]
MISRAAEKRPVAPRAGGAALWPSASLPVLSGLLVAWVFVSACGTGGLPLQADGCWGQGTGDCFDAQASALRALGFESVAVAALSSGLQCSDPVNCRSLLAASSGTKRAKSVERGASTAPTSSAPAVDAVAGEAVAPPEDAAGSDGIAAEGSGQEPAGEETTAPEGGTAAASAGEAADGQAGSEPVAMASQGGGDSSTKAVASGGGECAGLQIAGMEQKASLSKSEVSCLLAAATGQVSASDADRQTAAVALYNAKVSGWPKAVEAALSQPSLRNAPALNFAGLKPAYDAGRYSTVLQRADRVWTNFKRKGYQLSASDKTFVLEYSCRSAFQLHQTGKTPEKGVEWCEGWLDRLERAGADMSQAQDIYDQLN